MLDPKTLCDTYTIVQEPAFNPDDPFNDGSGFDPGDPFGELDAPEPIEPEENGESEPQDETTYTVLTKVRLSQSSGDRAVDAQGDKDASQAILFYFRGVSRSDGKLDIPDVRKGDKVIEGSHKDDTSIGNNKIWTVKGVKPLKSRNRVHHLEINLV